MEIETQPEPVVTRLCSDFDEYHELTCDLPLGHRGEHQATVFWGSDGND